MILIEKASITGLEETIRGMRNPMNSWDKSDSGICKGGVDGVGCSNCAAYDCEHTYDGSFQIGKNDHELMMKLTKGGSVHGKFRRMIAVYVDITAPLYWWKEFDTYKVGTVANSCSTMHKIHAKEFVIDDFSHEHLDDERYFDVDAIGYGDAPVMSSVVVLKSIVEMLNNWREVWVGIQKKLNGSDEISTEERSSLLRSQKDCWWQMIQLLPSSYNQKRTIMLNYEVLAGIYRYRREHKLDEWREFCRWIEDLPWSEIITGTEVSE